MNQKFIDPLRALALIEGLCMTHESYDLDDPSPSDQLINQIYMIAHSANYSSCHETHEDWRTNALKTEEELVRANIISAWGEPHTI